jgi:flavodoxin
MKKITAFVLMAVMAISLTACWMAENRASGSTSAAVETVNSEQTSIENTEERDKAGSSETAQSDEVAKTEKTEIGSDVLVIYFSHTGTTKKAAEYLHGIVGGDIVEIKPVKAYPNGYSDALDPAKEEQRENTRPGIADPVKSINSYKTIYLGYPIWWGTVPMIINTFLESYDFSDKTVVPFCTSGGTGNSQSMKDIRAEIPDANVLDGLRVTDNKDIIPWLKNLGLYSD